MEALLRIAALLADAGEAVKKAAAELEALKKDLIAHPQTDGSATDALAAEIERDRAGAITAVIPVFPPKDVTP